MCPHVFTLVHPMCALRPMGCSGQGDSAPAGPGGGGRAPRPRSHGDGRRLRLKLQVPVQMGQPGVGRGGGGVGSHPGRVLPVTLKSLNLHRSMTLPKPEGAQLSCASPGCCLPGLVEWGVYTGRVLWGELGCRRCPGQALTHQGDWVEAEEGCLSSDRADWPLLVKGRGFRDLGYRCSIVL